MENNTSCVEIIMEKKLWNIKIWETLIAWGHKLELFIFNYFFRILRYWLHFIQYFKNLLKWKECIFQMTASVTKTHSRTAHFSTSVFLHFVGNSWESFTVDDILQKKRYLFSIVFFFLLSSNWNSFSFIVCFNTVVLKEMHLLIELRR